MKAKGGWIIAAVLAAAVVWSQIALRGLREELSQTTAALEAAKAARAEVQETRLPPRSVPPPPVAPKEYKEPESKEKADAEKVEQEVELRVKDRLEAIQREKEREREERRREWENMTDEEREEKRREFQASMLEHATARLNEFVEKVGLDEEQRLAFEDELGALDSKVREVINEYASYIEDGGEFGFETQLLLMSDMSSVMLDAYAGLDEVLPEGWRESDKEFNLMFGIGPDAINPLMDAMQKKTGRRMRGFVPGIGMPPPPRHRRQ